ncbi:hypothetical protein Hanom_Chr12g01168401 [Helianthus anomalus]
MFSSTGISFVFLTESGEVKYELSAAKSISFTSSNTSSFSGTSSSADINLALMFLFTSGAVRSHARIL